MNTTVIYHSADFDGIFCREIARKFLGDKDVQYIGWNFGDPKVPMPSDGMVYIMDLSPECLDGFIFTPGFTDGSRIVWIDHHKTSIEQWPEEIPGYRIDGVAACRLTWQWFTRLVRQTIEIDLPEKEHFVNREVFEPMAVRLAGEYDVWDHRGDGDIEFQYGLRSQQELNWSALLNPYATAPIDVIIEQGKIAMRYARFQDGENLREAGFVVEFSGLKFLALNTVGRGSGIFDSRDKPETGHDALLAFGWRGKYWTVSLYHARHRTDLELSTIAVKHGGGGHKGACGFTCNELPFLL